MPLILSGMSRCSSTIQLPISASRNDLTFHHDSYLVDMSFSIEGVTESYDIGLGTNFGIVEWGDGFIGLIGSASRVDDKIEKETPETGA